MLNLIKALAIVATLLSSSCGPGESPDNTTDTGVTSHTSDARDASNSADTNDSPDSVSTTTSNKSESTSASVAARPPAPSGGNFVGGDSCKGCHQEQFNDWQGSHHDLAMQLPTDKTVLADFNDTSFTYAGVTSRFTRQGEKFVVTTDGEDGQLQNFEVAYVFGVYPLQQYLLPLSRGRLQALNISWDTRPADEGGQRWFHLYPDEEIDYTDPLHWTGHYQNWNANCAECHSTDLQKNYEEKTNSYDTVYKEVNVSCEACHGPGESHVKLATENTFDNFTGTGFDSDIAQRGNWKIAEGQSIAMRDKPLDSHTQVDSCGRCHSRRSTLGDYQHGTELHDTHRPTLVETPLYYPDGQILDEVYVYGSYLQSKMHQAGVVCSNCHDPHTAELHAPGNDVCAQCHLPDTYDSPAHHHHDASNAGARCANCHMPETTYMVVDPRRDHSLRIPRPDLSLTIDTPNACNQCHTDQSAQWSVDALRDWGVDLPDTRSDPATAFALYNEGDTRELPSLLDIVTDPDQPVIWRATALETLSPAPSQEVIDHALDALQDDDPMLRISAVRSLASVPGPQRLQTLLPLASDKATAVRMEVASSLAEVPLDQIPEQMAKTLQKIFTEYLSIHQRHVDMPGTRLQLGQFYTARGDEEKAEQQYLQAISVNSILLPAYLNLADIYRSQSREDEARDILLQALEVMPDNADTLHALGLLETRTNNTDEALDYLRRAAELEEAGTRHRFVYAIALHDLGEPRAAISALEALVQNVPYDQDALLALSNYHAELGERDKAAQYAQRLIRLSPGNEGYQRLYDSLDSGQQDTGQ